MINRIQEQQHVMTTRVNQTSNISDQINTISSNKQEFTQKNEDHLNIENQWKIEKEQIEEMINGFNDFLTPTHTDLKFEFHEQLNEYYVTLVNSSTKEVVKEIPPKKMLDMYASIIERIGIIVDQKI